jgi:aspartyl-tRNA(Asn)/glutamyl-tRNA(Gln) amidotransferase subunit B
VERVRASLPELPEAKRQRFVEVFGLSDYEARVLVMEQAIAHYYEAVVAGGANPKAAASWILGGLFTIMNTNNFAREDIEHTKISAEQFAELVKLVSDGTINKGTATTVLAEMWETGASPGTIVQEKGLAQVSDTGLIGETIARILAENDKMVQDYLGGKEKLFGALVGMCMKALKGQGNPQVVNEMLKQQIEAKRR